MQPPTPRRAPPSQNPMSRLNQRRCGRFGERTPLWYAFLVAAIAEASEFLCSTTCGVVDIRFSLAGRPMLALDLVSSIPGLPPMASSCNTALEERTWLARSADRAAIGEQVSPRTKNDQPRSVWRSRYRKNPLRRQP